MSTRKEDGINMKLVSMSVTNPEAGNTYSSSSSKPKIRCSYSVEIEADSKEHAEVIAARLQTVWDAVANGVTDILTNRGAE